MSVDRQMAEFKPWKLSAGGKYERITVKSCPLMVHNIAKPSTDNALFNGQRTICPALISRPKFCTGLYLTTYYLQGTAAWDVGETVQGIGGPLQVSPGASCGLCLKHYFCHLERNPDPSVLNDFGFIMERTTAAFFVNVHLLFVRTNIRHRFNLKSVLPSCIPILTGEPYFNDVPMWK